jgi:hypothetical protein
MIDGVFIVVVPFGSELGDIINDLVVGFVVTIKATNHRKQRVLFFEVVKKFRLKTRSVFIFNADTFSE